MHHLFFCALVTSIITNVFSYDYGYQWKEILELPALTTKPIEPIMERELQFENWSPLTLESDEFSWQTERNKVDSISVLQNEKFESFIFWCPGNLRTWLAFYLWIQILPPSNMLLILLRTKAHLIERSQARSTQLLYLCNKESENVTNHSSWTSDTPSILKLLWARIFSAHLTGLSFTCTFTSEKLEGEGDQNRSIGTDH